MEPQIPPLEWTLLETHWELRFGPTTIFLEPRPHYCDRGHWIGKAFNLPGMDAGDGFPRYYMNAERAKAELKEWLLWRFQRNQRLPLGY